MNHVALEVADKLVSLFDEAPYEAAGVEFVMEPTAFGDLKIAFLTDPSGVRIELIEHR